MQNKKIHEKAVTVSAEAGAFCKRSLISYLAKAGVLRGHDGSYEKNSVCKLGFDCQLVVKMKCAPAYGSSASGKYRARRRACASGRILLSRMVRKVNSASGRVRRRRSMPLAA